MGKHQKRIAAPRSWKIERKVARWTVKPRSGAHPQDRSIPLLLVVRDMLKLADSSREAKQILDEGNVLVNGRVRKDHKFSVGIFDILAIPRINAQYMVLMDQKERLALAPIAPEAATKKLCRVNGKRMIKDGAIQVNLHDGRNILPGELSAEIHPHDSLLISIPDNAIVKHLPFKAGSKVVVIGGRHSAQTGEVEAIEVVRSSQPNVVRIKSSKGEERFESQWDMVFVVGEEQIEVPGLGAA
jgi:small subunit ribosomal protein S4e